MSAPVSPRGRRIALLTGNYVNVVDGVSLTLNRLVRYLCARGDDVLVLAPGAKNNALDPAGEFEPVPSIMFGLQPEYRVAVGLTGSARRRIEAFRPDLVHVATPDFLGSGGIRYARRHGIPVVGSFHTNIASYMRYVTLGRYFERLVWWQMRRFYNRCDRGYVPTPSMESELRRRGFEVPTEIWARGVDTDRFSPDRRSVQWRRKHGIADDEVVVLFVARLRWEKGLDLLARVFLRLDQLQVPYRPVIVGDGVGYESLRKQLPRAVMTGQLDGDELSAAYASGDMFLYPSETDTFGNVTLEAMASGLPAICADAPGAKSLVRVGETGWLARAGDESSFVEKVSQLTCDPELRRRQGEAAAVHARSFSWTACMESLSNSYDDVLRRGRAVPSLVMSEA